MPRKRWLIVSLLFIATTINYMDRILLAVLLPVIRDEFHFDESVYGEITAAFQVAYAVGALICGKVLDRYGTKIGLALSAGIWSVAAILHATVTSPMQFGIWRWVLGLSEAGNFPAGNKAVAEWFSPEERGFAVGLYTAGVNIASILGPPLFITIQRFFGWRACFIFTGSIGLVWMVIWFFVYHVPNYTSDTGSSLKMRQVPFRNVVRYRQAWGYAIAKFLTDPVWWFLLFWLPLYFHDVRHFEMTQLAWALPLIYLMADVGAVSGGWFSTRLIRHGWTVGGARKAALLICALAMPIAGLAVVVESSIVAIFLFSLATTSHNAWATNLFTTPSDIFPREAVGQVSGLGGFLGGAGGVFVSAIIPGFLIRIVGYAPLFIAMTFLYFIALAVVHWLMGDFRRVTMEPSPEPVLENAG